MTGTVILVGVSLLLVMILLCLTWAAVSEFKIHKEQEARLKWVDYQRVVGFTLYDASRATYNDYVFEIRREARPSQRLWTSEVYKDHQGNLYSLAHNYAFSKREAKEMAICSADAIDFEKARKTEARTNQGDQHG